MSTTKILERLELVEQRLAGHAATEAPAGLTEPDPGDTERWEAAQVWAHIAEFVGYWHRQLELVNGNYKGTPIPFGRTKADAERIEAIEAGRQTPIPQSMAEVRAAIEALRRYLHGVTNADWSAIGLHPTRGEMPIEGIVERFVLDHLEEHADQLDLLAANAV